MSSLFRRRKVSCFYCGQYSAHSDSAIYHSNGRVSFFACPHCGADNHLDENGEIDDYVPETPPKPMSFAHRRLSARTGRPPGFKTVGLDGATTPTSDSRTFCTQCEHNQLIVQTGKAQYEMPPEDHPDHDHHANVLYPRYIKDLEARYPQMCAECIPRVKRRLKQVNYDAKVASLGHMLARSERPYAAPRMFGPIRVVKWCFWALRGAVWLWANMLFLVWHLSSMVYPAGSDKLSTPGWTQCLLSSMSKSELDATCYHISYHQASHYFPWTLLGFWWLYRQGGVEQHPEKKLVGGREYLNIEIATVVVRTIAWTLLRQGGWMESANEEIRVQAHALFFFVSFVAFLFSITCLKLEDPPSFSLRETGPPSPEKIKAPSPDLPASKRDLSPIKPQQRLTPRLSLTKTPPLRPIYSNQPIPPITPTYRDNNAGIVLSPSPTPRRHIDDDEMDWDPITPAPSFRANPWGIRDSSESPTRTLNLMSRPLSLSSDIRFGYPQSPASSIFAQTPTAEPDPVKRNPVPPLAEAKFRRIAQPSDTGLEGLLDGGLKIVDEPEVIAVEGMGREREGLVEVLGRLAVLVLAGGIVGFAPRELRVVALPIVVSAALWRMARGTGATTKVFSVVEILAALVTGSICALGGEKVSGNVGVGIVAVAALAEVWRLLLRMQRERKREFWREERRNALRESGKEGAGSPRTSYDRFGFRRGNSPVQQGRPVGGMAVVPGRGAFGQVF